MSTQQRRPLGPYLKLIRRFPLRPLRSAEDLDEATEVLDTLTDRLDTLIPEERDYLDVLTDLVERYESDTIPMPAVTDQALLRHLIEARGVSRVDVARATGITDSSLADVLAGRRKLNRIQIGKLSRYFHVEPGAFTFEA